MDTQKNSQTPLRAEENPTSAMPVVEELDKAKQEVSPEKNTDRKKLYIIGGCALATVAVAGCVWGINAYNKSKEITLPLEPIEEADTTQQVVETTERGIEIESSAEGWDEQTSTPMIVHVSGTTQSGNSVDLWDSARAQGSWEADLSAGSYEVSFISPINADGSIYAVPETTQVEVPSEGKATLASPLELIDANSATKEQVDAVVAQIQDASTKAKETDPLGPFALIADEVTQKAIENAANNPAQIEAGATTETIEATSQEQASSGSSSVSAPTTTPTQTTTTTTTTNNTPKETTTTTTETPKEKKWVVDYKSVWVPNVVTVVDKEAWDEPVYDKKTVFIASDGHRTSTEDEMLAYMKSVYKSEGKMLSWSFKTEKVQVDTIHHPAETHTEDHGYYTQVEDGGHWE